jgi:O-antigen/teichoic acid export membrane protein
LSNSQLEEPVPGSLPPSRRGPSTGRLVARNTGAQVVTFAARALAGLIAVVLIARHGGPHLLGVFQFGLTLSQMFGFAVGLGMPNLITREVARDQDRSRDWIGMGVFVALSAGVVVTVGLALAMQVSGRPHEMVVAVSLAAVALSFDTVGRLEFAAFEGWERMWLEAGATCLQEACFIAGTVAMLLTGHGAAGVMAAYVVSRMIGALTGWVIASWHLGGPVAPRPPLSFLRATLRRTVPFALDDALSLTYIRIDAVLLGFIKGADAVGLYQAATNLVLYLNILARVLNTALYPRMSKAWPNVARLGRWRDASLQLLGLISVPAMIGSLLLAHQTFDFIYTSKFDAAVRTYQVLALVIAIRMLGHTLGTSITAANHQTQRTIVVAAAAFTNTALNLYFIPRWSYLGAAITTAITETGVFVAYVILARHYINRSKLLEAVALPGLACVPMIVVVLALRNQVNLLVTIAAGACAYAVGLAAVAAVRIPASARRHPRTALRALIVRSAE